MSALSAEGTANRILRRFIFTKGKSARAATRDALADALNCGASPVSLERVLTALSKPHYSYRNGRRLATTRRLGWLTA